MSADFHNLGRRLFLSDRLKNILRVAADALAVSFSKLAGILSTPQDLLLGLPWESPSLKMQAVPGRQKGVMVPGVPCVNRENWG